MRDDSATGGYEDNMYGGGRGTGSGYHGFNGQDNTSQPPLPKSAFVYPSSSSLAAAASIGSSWKEVGWRAPIGAMSTFDNDIHNIHPLEPLEELDKTLPAALQMQEVIQSVQVRVGWCGSSRGL